MLRVLHLGVDAPGVDVYLDDGVDPVVEGLEFEAEPTLLERDPRWVDHKERERDGHDRARPADVADPGLGEPELRGGERRAADEQEAAEEESEPPPRSSSEEPSPRAEPLVGASSLGHTTVYEPVAAASGHSAVDGRVERTVSPPASIPEEQANGPSAPTTTQFRHFRHPDGRQWSIRVAGQNVDLVIVLPDGEQVQRTRRLAEPTDAHRDMQKRVADQQANGFIEA
ncbi:hypothetical protein DB30_02244 [Enhygromyxa salina]|uniref:Uncharacterized protein n=1 Tax=Enhygromyxa salina TaxID=215803 RepID=A0A0C1ZM30_9BACT|nr:hypothetical protein DB30_02244 [Enhygromyxa salina]